MNPGRMRLVEFLTSGDWYLGIYNDNEEPQTVTLEADNISKHTKFTQGMSRLN